MVNKVPVNSRRVSTAMAERGLGTRDIDALAGLTPSTTAAIFTRNGIHTATPIGRVARLLDATGLTWGAVFDDPAPAQTPETLADEQRVVVLARLLTTSTTGIPIDHLCVVLGVCAHELQADIDGLRPRLQALGFTVVHGNNGVVRVDRGHDPTTDHVEQQLAELDQGRRGLEIEAARTLWLAYHGQLPATLSKKHRLPLARLANRGVIDNDGAHGTPTVSAATLHCLTVE